MKHWMSSLLLAGIALASWPARSEIVAGSLDVRWNEGAEDCAAHAPPPLQVHKYAEGTFILRESLCATFEGPFMYLLIGSKRAMLIDSGDVGDAREVPLAKTVLSLLPGEGASKLPLLVVHTHGHLDHRAGDAEFDGMPNVEIVGTDLDHVRQYFGFPDWPNGMAEVDLGDRTVDVMPTPGHYPSHVSYYDRQTALFFSGDFFMPGRLLIDDAAADLASAKRVVDFAATHPISHVLGGHIELDEAGETFDFGSQYHPHERALALSPQDLAALPATIASFNGIYNRSGMFVMMSQTRVLAILGVGTLAVLVAIGFALRGYWRRRRRIRFERARG